MTASNSLSQEGKQPPIAHIHTSQPQHWRSWFTAQVQAVWKYVEEMEWHTLVSLPFMLLKISVTTLWMKINRLSDNTNTMLMKHLLMVIQRQTDYLLAGSVPVEHSGHLHSIVYWQVWDFTLVSNSDDDSRALSSRLFMAPSWCRRTWWWGSTSGTRRRRTASGVQGSDPSSPHILWSQPDRRKDKGKFIF